MPRGSQDGGTLIRGSQAMVWTMEKRPRLLRRSAGATAGGLAGGLSLIFDGDGRGCSPRVAGKLNLRQLGGALRWVSL